MLDEKLGKKQHKHLAAGVEELLSLDDRLLLQNSVVSDPRREALKSLVADRVGELVKENERYKDLM